MMPDAVVRRHYTESRFGQLHYLEGHPADGEPAAATTLVLLHQNPSSSQEYAGLVAEMARDRQVIAFDTPGNGMSDGPSGPRLIADYSAAFSDGLDALGFGPERQVDLFGFHTGTLLAAELALQRPNLVRRVMMSGIPFRDTQERAKRLAEIQATPPLTDDGKAVFDRSAWLWNYVVTKRDPRVPIDRAAFMFMEKSKTMNRYWWPYFGVWSYAVEDRFPQITQPVLVIQPWENLLEPSRQAAQLIPDATFIELPDLVRDVFEVGIPEFALHFRRFLG